MAKTVLMIAIIYKCMGLPLSFHNPHLTSFLDLEDGNYIGFSKYQMSVNEYYTKPQIRN